MVSPPEHHPSDYWLLLFIVVVGVIAVRTILTNKTPYNPDDDDEL